MRAALLNEGEAKLHLEDIVKPRPRRGEVLVKVAAAGVCHTDLHVIKNEVKFPKPAVLGHEISGIVEETGDGVSGIKPGDRVVCPFIMPCGYCYYCSRGMDDMCENFFKLNRLQGRLYDGETRLRKHDGTPVWMYSMAGLAEYAVVPSTAVFKLPEKAPLHKSAILGCAVFTAYGALKNAASLRTGESAAVVAVGGVGTSLLYLASLTGVYPLAAVDIRDEKLEFAKKLGASHVINSQKEDVVQKAQEITDGRGFDVVFEAFGSSQTVETALSLVRDGGRVVLIGIAPVGVRAGFEITRLVRRGIKITGSYGARTRTDMPEVLRLVEGGRLNPEVLVSQQFRFEEVNEAFEKLGKGEIVARSIVRVD
ncbi:MAG: zinc-binding dehydrogenase [Candidatus Caldarchaeum sp.]|uniref:Alcohol dehydrogenase n=1 Tax=Caldiarchaeum subterraneum TaxID=311458 RepID=A0A7C5Q6T2_CALS0